MQVATLDVREHNTVLLPEGRYFVFEDEGRLFLVLDRCPHRGGPLSLATLSPDRKRLTCPWHGSRISCGWLRRQSVPLVRRGTEITAYLPDGEADGAVVLAKRRITANEPDTETREAVHAG
jgi:Rieske [2Fe-2S] domain